MTNDVYNVTRSPLGRREARFLAKVGARATFSIAQAREVLEHQSDDPTRQFLEKLQTKGWIAVVLGPTQASHANKVGPEFPLATLSVAGSVESVMARL